MRPPAIAASRRQRLRSNRDMDRRRRRRIREESGMNTDYRARIPAGRHAAR
jgi:hypothetical protein